MKSYSTKDIRNVGIGTATAGTGKTQLVSSLLYTAGMTPRWGKSCGRQHHHPIGTKKEIQRKISIQTAWPTPNGPARFARAATLKLISSIYPAIPPSSPKPKPRWSPPTPR